MGPADINPGERSRMLPACRTEADEEATEGGVTEDYDDDHQSAV
jgi:hypothetical protein